MKDNIVNIYESIYNRSQADLLVEIDVSVTEPEESTNDINVVNIYIRPVNGPIQRPYSGNVINTTRLENNVTIIADDVDSKKLIQVILMDGGDIAVNIQDSQGRVQDTFMGQDLDFYDDDTGGKELNVMKIENV
jgi:hypothetical protein